MDVDQLVEAVDPARSVTFEMPDAETIIDRASAGRRFVSGSRSWTARSRPAAWAWVAVVAVLVLVLVFGFRVGFTSKSKGVSPAGRSLPVSVDLAATPAGWVPVDYGDAQVSVPSSWVIPFDRACPSTKQGSVFLFAPTGPQVSCASIPQGNSVSFDTSKSRGTGSATVINGIKVYSFAGGADALEQGRAWEVPSLGIELTLNGPLSTRVLHTLTQSPRSVALATASAPPIPESWHSVSYGGISAAVPASWPIEHGSGWSTGCTLDDLTMFSTAAFLDSGANDGANDGANEQPQFCAQNYAPPLSAPKDGLLIDPGRYGPLENAPIFGPCLHINGLWACPTTADLYGVLVLAVHIPGTSEPVAVEIGLAGNGMVARTILYSIRAG